MQKNNSRRNRGRPQEPLELEVELIDSEEGGKRWAEIFRLLKRRVTDTNESLAAESDGLEYEQLRLF